MDVRVLIALQVLTAALAGCASAPKAAELVATTTAPPGFETYAPAVRIADGEVRVRGVLCRAPLSTHPAPRRLEASLEDDRNARLDRRSAPLSPLPVGRGARCINYRIALPQYPHAARVTLTFTGS